MAWPHHVAAGSDVHVLTCTLGEEGEVDPAAPGPPRAGALDRLGAYRREELREAMRRLGVSSAVLGEDPDAGVLSRFRDSGMAGMPSAEDPRAFVQRRPGAGGGSGRRAHRAGCVPTSS